MLMILRSSARIVKTTHLKFWLILSRKWSRIMLTKMLSRGQVGKKRKRKMSSFRSSGKRTFWKKITIIETKNMITCLKPSRTLDLIRYKTSQFVMIGKKSIPYTQSWIKVWPTSSRTWLPIKTVYVLSVIRWRTAVSFWVFNVATKLALTVSKLRLLNLSSLNLIRETRFPLIWSSVNQLKNGVRTLWLLKFYFLSSTYPQSSTRQKLNK